MVYALWNRSRGLIHVIFYLLTVIQAWKAKYLGTTHRALSEATDDLNNQPPARHYAKIIAMIQSSGTGKSETMDEITKDRVLFPLCYMKLLWCESLIDLSKGLYSTSKKS